MAMRRPVPDALVEAQDRFIAAWGQMGSTWGISRTMAEVHALLYITGEPLCTDDAMERLEISRGNASMSLRALVDWGIVTRVHKRGDRKEYYQAEQDVWSLLQAVVRQRVKREIHPALASLCEIRDMTGPGNATNGRPEPEAIAGHHARLDAMIELLRTFDQMGERLSELPTDELRTTAQALTRET
ncbi:MAG: ArsR family transcriptional regulator [Phycisphaeraceae bacterium]|nr:ArsR family transcriptional regulator [Phycisphaeraceae bacterium]